MSRQPKAVGHLDADCFYASAERVRHPFLIGKPVGVLGNNGACVIARSYEMKAADVKTGEPIWDARRKCPDGVYVKRDFHWYEVLSRMMLAAVREFSPAVEYYSIDEFFFEAVSQGGSYRATAEAMRDHIRKAVNVPVTVGIARSKTLAKLISDTAKPFGAKAVLDPDAERELLRKMPVTEVCGIAGRRAARLAPYGIRTCLELAQANRLMVRKLLTRAGEAIWWELNGEAVLPLHTTRPSRKMLSRGGSIGRPTDDPNRVWGWAVRSLERLIEELEYHQIRAGRLEVWLAYQDGRSVVGGEELLTPTDRFDLLTGAVRHALRRAWRPGGRLMRLHLIASQLRRPKEVQLGLFDQDDERAEAVAKAKREVNAKVRRWAVRSGATLWNNAIYADEASDFEICDIRDKTCF